MIIKFEPPFIVINKSPVKLVKDDYIMDNGCVLQFVPNETHYRNNCRKLGLFGLGYHTINKTEFNRLMKSYYFEKQTTIKDGYILNNYIYRGRLQSC